jgi:hypothetical protein
LQERQRTIAPTIVSEFDVRWMKIDPARIYAGDVSRKVMYDAVAEGKLRVAKYGEGRNMLFSDEWIDAWLKAESVNSQDRKTAA